MSKETDELLHHADVIKVIRAVLITTGLRGDLLGEAVRDVEVKAWVATSRDRPDSIVRWKKICRKIAKRHGIDALRKRIAFQGTHLGLTGDADLHAASPDYRPGWDVPDANKAVKLLFLMIDEGVLPTDFDAYLDAVHAREPQAIMAREAGLSEKQYRKVLWTGRQLLMQRFSAAGLGSLAVVGVLYLVLLRNPQAPIAHHDTPTGMTDAAPSTPIAPRPAPPPKALVDTHPLDPAALRQQAEVAAYVQDWSRCLLLYREIDRLERDGGRKSEDLRSLCEESYAKTFKSILPLAPPGSSKPNPPR
jgi:hypothetical protein